MHTRICKLGASAVQTYSSHGNRQSNLMIPWWTAEHRTAWSQRSHDQGKPTDRAFTDHTQPCYSQTSRFQSYNVHKHECQMAAGLRQQTSLLSTFDSKTTMTTLTVKTWFFWLKFHHHHTTTVLRPFFRDHPGEAVPEENFWTLWCKGRLTDADTPPSDWVPLHPD